MVKIDQFGNNPVASLKIKIGELDSYQKFYQMGHLSSLAKWTVVELGQMNKVEIRPSAQMRVTDWDCTQ